MIRVHTSLILPASSEMLKRETDFMLKVIGILKIVFVLHSCVG